MFVWFFCLIFEVNTPAKHYYFRLLMSVRLYPINPNRNQPWNELPTLPIDPALYQEIEVYEQLVKARSALGRLQGRSAAIPNQAVLINTISLREAKASSEIENIFTTDDELYKAYSQNNLKEVKGAAKEVLYYREAIWDGFEYLAKKAEMDMGYFIRMYRLIKQSQDGIRPSHVPVTIKQGGSGPNAGKVIYTPPRGAGIVESKLENLIQFVNDEQGQAIDPLLKMAIAHYQFEAIHPFRDGNGRTGRVFNIHFLTQKGLLDLPILFLSGYIIDHKSDYYETLAGVSQRGDWKRWLIYVLKAVEYASNATYYKINDILELQEAIYQVLLQDKKVARPEKLVEVLFTQPYTKVRHFTDAGIYAENTARNYLRRLCELGILEQKSIHGHHYYLNIDLQRILSQ